MHDQDGEQPLCESIKEMRGAAAEGFILYHCNYFREFVGCLFFYENK